MLEDAIPALWSAVNGFFTPTVLFILLNVVIGTIAVTSKSSAPAAAADGGESPSSGVVEGGVDHQQQRRLSRVPSIAFERLRSFNLSSRFSAPAPEAAAVDGVADLGYEQPPAPVKVEKVEPEAAADPEPEPEQEAQAHMERSRSEAAAELEVPRLPARLHKSASEKSAFSHFEAAEVEEAVQAVEKRRPATTRDSAAGRRGRRLPVAAAEESESESEGEGDETGSEVDAEAENFINRFHNQLKLQRMESILRYRENIRRGQAAAGGV